MTPYNQEDHLSIESSSPFNINARMNVPLGYNKKVCIRCTNGDQKIDHDNLIVDQSTKCKFALSAVKDGLPPKSLIYTDSTKLKTVNSDGWAKFFTNIDTKLCPMEKCSLTEVGCENQLK